MARFFFLLCLECVIERLRAAQNGKSRPGHASLSSTSRIHVWRGACAAWMLRFLLANGQRGGENRHTNLTGTGPRGAWVPRRGVGELLVVDLIDGAVDEHGRGHQRRRREGLPLVGRSPRDNMHDARRRRVGRAPPCVLAPPCVRTVMRNVHRRRCPRRLACSAPIDDRRHRWRMCLPAIQNRVQSRQLLQRRSNDSCRARCGWRVHLCVAARRFCTARDQRRASRRDLLASARDPRGSHVYASSGVT